MTKSLRGVVLAVALAAGGAGGQQVNTEPYRRPAPTPFSYPRARHVDGKIQLPSSWPSRTEFQPDTQTQTPEELLGWLVKEDPAQRMEALIRLLPWADKLLPQLERQVSTARDEASQAHLLVALREMTRHWVRLERLAAHPHLKALADAEVNRGQQLVAPWTEVTTTQELLVEPPPSEPCGSSPTPLSTLLPEGERFARLRNELATLGGFARPAVERLLESSSAEAKLHGFALAELLDLHPRRELLEQLRRDTVQVGTERIAARAGALQLRSGHLKESPEVGTPRLGGRMAEEHIEELLTVMPRPGGEEKKALTRFESLIDLINGLRQSGAFDARTEQDYWNRARPLWRSWWGMGGIWATRDAQRRWLRASEGLSGALHVSMPREDKQFWLRIEEPVGAKVRIEYQLELRGPWISKEGRAPLELNVPAGYGPKVHLWLDEKWQQAIWIAGSPGETRHVWMQPELLREEPESGRKQP